MKKITYKNLNPRQQESYNFQKVSAKLADYGFNTMRLSDDWQGADFIANHIDGMTFLKVQLKGRLTIAKKYIGKDIWVCFPHEERWYIYPHDVIAKGLAEHSNYMNTQSWKKEGAIHNATPSKKDWDLLRPYEL